MGDLQLEVLPAPTKYKFTSETVILALPCRSEPCVECRKTRVLEAWVDCGLGRGEKLNASERQERERLGVRPAKRQSAKAKERRTKTCCNIIPEFKAKSR